MIVIDSHLPKVLESLQKLKDKKEINQIKVVIGSMGYGIKIGSQDLKRRIL